MPKTTLFLRYFKHEVLLTSRLVVVFGSWSFSLVFIGIGLGSGFRFFWSFVGHFVQILLHLENLKQK